MTKGGGLVPRGRTFSRGEAGTRLNYSPTDRIIETPVKGACRCEPNGICIVCRREVDQHFRKTGSRAWFDVPVKDLRIDRCVSITKFRVALPPPRDDGDAEQGEDDRKADATTSQHNPTNNEGQSHKQDKKEKARHVEKKRRARRRRLD